MAVSEFVIVHLYPNELNLYGDYGNIVCLRKRLLWRGINSRVVNVGIGEGIPSFDILFIGGGQDKEMQIITADLKRKAQMICYSVEKGKTFLAICGGFQLLGEYYTMSDGNKMHLAEALPFYTVASQNRMVGNAVIDTDFGRLVGFENHSGKTYLSAGVGALGSVISGYGNNGNDKLEGVRYKNTFGTYLHGPVLPKNPAFADKLISLAAGEPLKELNDDIELACHNQLIKRFG